jgi:hypothetical protein
MRSFFLLALGLGAMTACSDRQDPMAPDAPVADLAVGADLAAVSSDSTELVAMDDAQSRLGAALGTSAQADTARAAMDRLARKPRNERKPSPEKKPNPDSIILQRSLDEIEAEDPTMGAEIDAIRLAFGIEK